MKSRTSNSNNETGTSSTAGIFSSLKSSLSSLKTHSVEYGKWLYNSVADNRWTILNAAGNGLGSLITACYYVDANVDILSGLDGQGKDQYIAELSFPGFVTGIVMAVFITSGSIYAHFVLNTNSTWAIKHKIYSQGENESEIDSRIELGHFQQTMRVFDYISHVADNAATNLFIFSFALKDPAMHEKIIATVVMTISALLTSRQDWITCGHNMRLHNRNALVDKKQLPNITPENKFLFLMHEFTKQCKEYTVTGEELSASLFSEGQKALQGVYENHLELRQATLRRRTITMKTEPNGVNYHLLEDGESELPERRLSL